jgi:hypothetical protein
MLTHKGMQTLLRVEQMMDEAGRHLSARADQPSAPEGRRSVSGSVATAQ